MRATLVQKNSTNQNINSSMNELHGNIMTTSGNIILMNGNNIQHKETTIQKQLPKNKNRQKRAKSRSIPQINSIAQKINPSQIQVVLNTYKHVQKDSLKETSQNLFGKIPKCSLVFSQNACHLKNTRNMEARLIFPVRH